MNINEMTEYIEPEILEALSRSQYFSPKVCRLYLSESIILTPSDKVKECLKNNNQIPIGNTFYIKLACITIDSLYDDIIEGEFPEIQFTFNSVFSVSYKGTPLFYKKNIIDTFEDADNLCSILNKLFSIKENNVFINGYIFFLYDNI